MNTENAGLPARGAAAVAADVDVQVVDLLPVAASRQAQLDAARRQLAARDRAVAVTQEEDEDATPDAAGAPGAAALTRFSVRDARGTMRYLVFEDGTPVVGLGARLKIRQGCAVHRDVLVARGADVRVLERGAELTLEQRIWRLERP